MLFQLRNYNFYIIFFLDLLLFSLALFFAHLIRFEFALPDLRLQQFWQLLPLVLLIKSSAFFAMQLYRGMFRYTGLKDLWRLCRAVGLSSLVLVSGVAVIYGFVGYSRSVFLIDAVLTLLFTGCFRLLIRFFFAQLSQNREDHHLFHLFKAKRNYKVLLIYGAGSAGEKLYREIAENPRLKYRVAGFMDDDLKKLGRSIHGIPVWGGLGAMKVVTAKLSVQEVLIAVPSSTGAQMRAIVEVCKACDVPFRTLPGLGNIIDCKVDIKALRDVAYRDLLRRKPIVLDSEKIAGYLKEKVVMVTGAGGSIGSELCRQIIKFQPRQLILLDASESALYQLQMELKHRSGYQRYSTVLGHIQDEALIDRVMRHHEPQVIFHAAAYKHVPMLERNPWQAVSNNIRGNQVMLEKAMEYGVGHFVLVSTDKAVRPTNIMGASKRICELILQSHVGRGYLALGTGEDIVGEKDTGAVGQEGTPTQESSNPAPKIHPPKSITRFMAVRFGNVVGSSGSVIPLFRDQIERGGPVTVTHPDVTRYFMTIPEAAQLILQAGALGQGGETFILEMGESIKIADMARDLIRLSGLVPDDDIEIRFTGLRQGEKLYEELITEGEGIVPTTHEKIMVLKPNGHWNGHGTQQAYHDYLMSQLSDLYTAADQHDICAIRAKMQEIVPEFKVQDSQCVL